MPVIAQKSCDMLHCRFNAPHRVGIGGIMIAIMTTEYLTPRTCCLAQPHGYGFAQARDASDRFEMVDIV